MPAPRERAVDDARQDLEVRKADGVAPGRRCKRRRARQRDQEQAEQEQRRGEAQLGPTQIAWTWSSTGTFSGPRDAGADVDDDPSARAAEVARTEPSAASDGGRLIRKATACENERSRSPRGRRADPFARSVLQPTFLTRRIVASTAARAPPPSAAASARRASPAAPPPPPGIQPSSGRKPDECARRPGEEDGGARRS